MFISAQKYKNNPFCNCLVPYSVFSYSVFFKTLTWIKGLKTRKKGIGYFVMYFLLLYYIIYIYIYRYIDSI